VCPVRFGFPSRPVRLVRPHMADSAPLLGLDRPTREALARGVCRGAAAILEAIEAGRIDEVAGARALTEISHEWRIRDGMVDKITQVCQPEITSALASSVPSRKSS